MAQINLLPWREQQRDDRKRRFLMMIVLIVVAASGSIFLADQYVRNEINSQMARNSFIQNEIQLLDARVAEINQLQDQKREIRDRMNVIGNLQGSRPVIVRVFDELVKTLPEGVYFQSLERAGDYLNIIGVADSYGELTDLMRRLDASEWFADPNLQIISAAEGGSEGFSANAANNFTLDLALVVPGGQEELEYIQ